MAYNPWFYYPTAPVNQQPVNGLVAVTGIEGAKAYQLPPNSSMPLFDANEDVLYLKTTDGAGFPTVRVFDFTEREHKQPAHAQSEYVPRSEFDALVERINELTKEGKNAEQPVPETYWE